MRSQSANAVIASHVAATADEQDAAAAAYIADPTAANRDRVMSLCNLLIVEVATEMPANGVPIDDRVQIAWLALAESLSQRRFEPGRSRFSTYATEVMRRAIWKSSKRESRRKDFETLDSDIDRDDEGDDGPLYSAAADEELIARFDTADAIDFVEKYAPSRRHAEVFAALNGIGRDDAESEDDVAAHFGLSVRQVRRLRRQARDRLAAAAVEFGLVESFEADRRFRSVGESLCVAVAV